jgi:hypothetical protein
MQHRGSPTDPHLAAQAKTSPFDDGRSALRAQDIDEAGRALASDKVAVLLMPARPDGARRFQIGFEHGAAQNLTVDGGRALHRQLGQLLNIHDGKPPR